MSNTANTPEDLEVYATTAAGNTYRVAVYVDPFPGRKGADRIQEDCYRCGGSGYVSYGNVTIQVGRHSGRVCFVCLGNGYTSRLVSSARSTARRRAAQETAANAAAADFAATADDRAREELLADWDLALAEEARRGALVSGFLAPADTKVTGQATVKVYRTFEGEGYYGQPELKAVIILVDAETGKELKTVTTPRALEEGQEVIYKGTVKGHGNYKGQDQTILTRVTFK